MEAQVVPLIRHRIPWVTASVAALALATWAAPESVRAFTVYDRGAIQAGQIWRLWTCHLVHFSGSHLAWNLLVVVIAGAWIEEARFPRRRWFALMAPPLTSLALLMGDRNLQTYGGLSGIATAAVAFACASEWHRSARHRIVWSVVLTLIGMKIAWEFADGGTLFSHFQRASVRSVPLCHLAGASAGIAFAIVGRPRFGAAPIASPPVVQPERTPLSGP